MSQRPLVLATLDGYSVEGGFDVPGGPATCYAPTIALGRHLGPGVGSALWPDFDEVLEVTASTPLDGVRLGVEWARIEPRCDEFDAHALERYVQVARRARALGLRVTLTLIGDVWPLWLGLEAWLLPWVSARAVGYARRVLDAMGADVDRVLVVAHPEQLVARGFLDASAPPWRRRAREDAESARAQLARIVHDVEATGDVGSVLVRSSRTIDVDDVLGEHLDADVEELYVRALVKGKGPTAAKRGLLVRQGGRWTLAPDASILSDLA